MSELRYSSLIFVTHNSYKLAEYRTILQLPALEMRNIPAFIDQQDMNLETLTRHKIEQVKPILRNTPFFVEHTGLIIDAWNGLPGGLTRHFMETVGYDGLCKMMTAYQGSERQARLKTLIGYYYNKNIQIFEGTVSGSIAPEPRGTAGWEWDYIFIPAGYNQTYAEMGHDSKSRISMRYKAATDFAAYLSTRFSHDTPPLASFQSTDDDLKRLNLKRLMSYHQRRLQKLKEQQALHGASADPRIAIEIEDIEAELAKLSAQSG